MDKFKTIALILWWCEGTKRRRDYRWKSSYLHPIEISNSDPRIIRIFADYLREYLKVDPSRIKGQLQIHEGDDLNKLEGYWEKKTAIPRNQFNKTIVRKKGLRQGKNKGTFKLRFYNKPTFIKLQELLNKELQDIGV